MSVCIISVFSHSVLDVIFINGHRINDRAHRPEVDYGMLLLSYRKFREYYNYNPESLPTF